MTAPMIATVDPGPTWSGKRAPLATAWTAEVSPGNALPDYPRPQLARPSAARPEWLSLNGLWQYGATDGFSPPPFGRDLDGLILVPYPAESALSGVEEHSDFMFYRRTVDVPKKFTRNGRHVRLNFGAVNYAATVWVNGVQVARHTGGYDAFGTDITGALRARGPQEIVVAVHSPVDGENIPVGKQRLDPGGIFYTASSGIWQSVWIEPIAATSIASFTATPNVDSSSFSLSVDIDGDPTNAHIAVDVYAGTKRVARASGAADGRLEVSVPQPRLWSPDDPFLYTFAATLTRDGVKDTVESYAGLRSIALGEAWGKQRILLNGEPTFLLSTLDQGYWPDGISTAPTDEALKFDIQKTKDLGFNTIRKHIKVEPARWYYWADTLGVMVWQDAVSLPNERNDALSAGDMANFRGETARMVEQLRNVTSIIGWVPFNEGWGQWSVEAASAVGAQVKAQDPTRLVNDRSGSNCCDTPGDPGTGDIVDWHQYQGPALPAPDATRASIDGEHGGLTLTVDGHTWPGAPIDPYGSVANADELNLGYEANTAVLRDQGAPYGLSGAVYTQITDVEGEQNGFLTYDRRVMKVDESRVRAINLEVIEAALKPAPTPPAGTPGIDGVGHWRLDEGTGVTAADSSGDHDLVLVGAPTFPDGRVGAGLRFDGITQSAETDGTVIATDGRNYSVSAWVKLDRVDDAAQTVVSEDGDENSAFSLQYSGAETKFTFGFAHARAFTVGTPSVGRWYHVVGVRDLANSRLQIYVDGELSGSVDVLGNGDTATGNLALGRGKLDGDFRDYLAGSTDDVRAFDRAVTPREVGTLYAAVAPR